MTNTNKPRAYCIGVVTDLEETLENLGAEKGSLFVLLEDTSENRKLTADLLKGALNSKGEALGYEVKIIK